MLNCGGSVDLGQKWLGQSQQVKVYVLDSHRPAHHNNIHSHKLVIMVDDGTTDFKQVPALEDFYLGEGEEEEEEDQEEEEEEEYLGQNKQED